MILGTFVLPRIAMCPPDLSMHVPTRPKHACAGFKQVCQQCFYSVIGETLGMRIIGKSLVCVSCSGLLKLPVFKEVPKSLGFSIGGWSDGPITCGFSRLSMIVEREHEMLAVKAIFTGL